ncbi:MAG: phage tail protein, partial [Bacteroidota bacterium]
ANAADQTSAEETYLAETTGGINIYHENATPGQYYGGVLNEVTVGVQNNGGSQPINNLQPYLVVNYIIALVGLFPSRS